MAERTELPHLLAVLPGRLPPTILGSRHLAQFRLAPPDASHASTEFIAKVGQSIGCRQDTRPMANFWAKFGAKIGNNLAKFDPSWPMLAQFRLILPNRACSAPK